MSDPGFRLLRIHEGERQRAEPVPGGRLDGLAVGAGQPHGRMRLLQGLRDHVATGHREAFPFVAGVRLQHHHVGDLLRGLERQRLLLLRRIPKPCSSSRVAPSPMPNSTRPLEIRSSMATDSAVRADGCSGESPGGCRSRGGCPGCRRPAPRGTRRTPSNGILLQEVVLHRPRVVNSQPVGEAHLFQRLMDQPMLRAVAPGFRQLQLVEDSETHEWLLWVGIARPRPAHAADGRLGSGPSFASSR
jgi:hypothetical protein